MAGWQVATLKPLQSGYKKRWKKTICTIGSLLPLVPVEQFPAVALACELYLEGGIRAVEIGRLMFGASATMDLVRLAIPRRVYTQSHVDYVVEIILEVWKKRGSIGGLNLTHEAPFLRHFTAKLEPVTA